MITDFKIFNKPVPISQDSVLKRSITYSEDLTLSYKDDVFSFEFAALNYIDSNKNRYRYRYKLEGLEPDWNDVDSKQRLAIYTNLDPGRYVFRVQGSNNDGVWNEEGISLPILVTPPWWLTWWFRTLSAIAVLVMLVAFYRYRVNRLHVRTLELEGVVAERTRSLADSNEQLFVAKEKAEAASEAKSVFLASISHELRTPLNAILGYAELLKKDAVGNLSEGLGVIKSSGEHLLTLINDILDLTKIEAGKLEFHNKLIHLPEVLRQIADIILARAEHKGLILTYESLSDLPEVVEADETRLRQVLLNLLGNAVKFTDDGSVVLTVEKTDEPGLAENQVHLRFRVEDTGVGIAKENLEQIFKPFEQSGEARRKTEGTGLGLAISRDIVQALGGEIHVESELGRGSTFWFDVVLNVAEADDDKAEDQMRSIIGYEGERKRVLVVDDKLYNRMLLTDLLSPLGFEIEVAEDGEQAIGKVKQWQPDIVLMDLVMPVKSGFEAIQEIRALPEFAHLPLIAVSASISKNMREKYPDAHYDVFLSKPLNVDRLLSVLKKFLLLTWEYQQPKNSTDTVTVPPKPALLNLIQMAEEGKVFEIEDFVDTLEQQNSNFKIFAREVKQKAKQFDLDLLKEYLNQHLQ